MIPYATLREDDKTALGLELGDLLGATEIIDEAIGWAGFSSHPHLLVLPRRLRVPTPPKQEQTSVWTGGAKERRYRHDVLMHVESVDGDASDGDAAAVPGWPTYLDVDDPESGDLDSAQEVVGVMGFGSLEAAGSLTATLAAGATAAAFLSSPTAGEVYLIDDEVLLVLDTDPVTVARGQALTSDAEHASGAAVRRVKPPDALERAARRVAGRFRIAREQPGNVIGEEDEDAAILDKSSVGMLDPYRAPSGSFRFFDHWRVDDD